ncbi:hypothetical protein MMIC_P2299 [Mariprofundus micogutta]|uniref:Uncharacterized protein n=1 Tax=Mariprofundus micogutta TaxID=1921010 RepID=A0A1L8CQV5_9PROT|nr:hypothetical protein [Mariprofundus micogutta]GAV21316.1 hypothetical protein MMIC_P2299 [Mariprofundus micogutta]
MKRFVWLLFLPALLGLSACELDRHELHEARHNLSYTMKMHHIHMLINHALQMAAQGADMNLNGVDRGPVLLEKSTDLMKRAMSGPEMAQLHKLGNAGKPLMKMTHELADNTTLLIEAMKTLSTGSKDKDAIRMLNHAIEVAATGSSLIMLGQQGMAGDIDAVMVNHGQSMLGEASGLLQDVAGTSEYKTLVTHVVHMLIGIPEMPVASDRDD